MKKEPKILNVMRISAILLSLCVFSSFASKTSSQNVKVNMSGKNMTIANFIDQIEQQRDSNKIWKQSLEDNLLKLVSQNKIDTTISELQHKEKLKLWKQEHKIQEFIEQHEQ